MSRLELFHLKPGDVLLYSGKGFFSRLIQIKTWSRFSHSEIYIGNSKTITSRDGKGVNTYDIDFENLSCILRPIGGSPDLSEALEFHTTCIGQKYDFLGLFRFFAIGKQTESKSFCSEHCTRFARKIKILNATGHYFKPFNEKYDADLVSPGMFYSSPNYDIVWERN